MRWSTISKLVVLLASAMLCRNSSSSKVPSTLYAVIVGWSFCGISRVLSGLVWPVYGNGKLRFATSPARVVAHARTRTHTAKHSQP
uniref:Putative secreted protein n=1 Tax=Anopheles triannulatus TaxID=58253 RepID=A0A2M4B7G7_9DIPT